ncbi:MAG: Glycosyl hydrolases family 43 [Firmicutes bacterium ADurb.Bin193]|nr:MAG: Glycosyl hydrolases family 43 [Firmicutes bacterium ADurb.Bin193]
MLNNCIKPGQVWLDTDGKRIHAHGGSIITVDDTFYWYGENKEKTLPDDDIWHWGIRCYASKDLYNWEDKGLIIPPEPDDIESPLHPSKGVDRPHILYNKKTKKYVCWLKVMGKQGRQTETVLTADNILGPYTIVNRELMPLGMNGGDFDLVAHSDGKAYYYFERVHKEIICADLTDDYTDVTGYYSTHFPQPFPPFVREAPAHFYRKGKHYMFTSGTTGYHPNPTEVAVAKTYHGPWEVLGNPHRNDPSRTSFNSQISSVFKHPYKKDLYIALADRWITDLPARSGGLFETGEQYQKTADWYESLFNPDKEKPSGENQFPDKKVNTSIADYVWLPVKFDGDIPYLEWYDQWRIEDFE